MKISTMNLWFSLLLVITALFVFSCREPESPKATVTVLNRLDNNKPVANAIVTVYADVPMGKVEPTQDGAEIKIARTDASGKVNFDFNTVSILNVMAEIPVANYDTLYGIGVLRLKEDENYEETVYLSQYKSQF